MTRFSALGDVAMTIPVVYSACRCHPDTRFVMVTRPSMTSIFVDAPANLTVVGADVKERYAGVSGIATLCRELRAEYTPDIFVDLHNVLRTRLMAAFLRLHGVGTVRIIKPRAKRRALTRRRNKVMLPLTGQRARYREAFFKAGLPIVERFNGLYGGHGKAPAECFAAITAPVAWIFAAILSVIVWLIFKLKIKGFKKSFFWYIGLCALISIILVSLSVFTSYQVLSGIFALLIGGSN